jgi:hypothetical protein
LLGAPARTDVTCFRMWLMASQTAVPDAAEGGATRKDPGRGIPVAVRDLSWEE